MDVIAPVARSRPSCVRTRGGFPILRVILLCWLVVFALKSLRHATTRPPSAIPAPVTVSPSPFPETSSEVDTLPDVASLDTFVAWRADHPQTKQSRKLLEGRDIRWTGILKKSLVPGRYELAQEGRQGKGTVRLLPVTDDAKQDLRRIDSGGRVEVEGVLMDEHSLHLVAVRQMQ